MWKIPNSYTDPPLGSAVGFHHVIPQAQTLFKFPSMSLMWRWHACAGEHLHGCTSIPSGRWRVVWCFVARLQQASTVQRLWAKNITSIGQPAPPACAQLHAHYASNQQTLRPLHSTTELYAAHGYQKVYYKERHLCELREGKLQKKSIKHDK